MSNTAQTLSKRQALKALGVSLLLGMLVFVTLVLPAEYGLDPTGTGEWLGIKGMGGYQVAALRVEAHSPHDDQVTFPLAPFESVEYKYELAAGAAVMYEWSAEAQVLFDLHSEAQGTDPEDAVSFSVGRGESEAGTYVAPYDGIHGWFWENRGAQEVTVTLRTRGYYAASITYSPAGEYRREF